MVISWEEDGWGDLNNALGIGLKYERLDFRWSNDVLEACVRPRGYYDIGGSKSKFFVYGYLDEKCFSLGHFETIYDALDAANQHYQENL